MKTTDKNHPLRLLLDGKVVVSKLDRSKYKIIDVRLSAKRRSHNEFKIIEWDWAAEFMANATYYEEYKPEQISIEYALDRINTDQPVWNKYGEKIGRGHQIGYLLIQELYESNPVEDQ